MTAARQERKMRRRNAVSVALLGTTALIAAAAFAPTAIRAATSELVIANRYTGLAIDGFDPVAYFVDGGPELGRAELEWHSAGATWRFRNEGNRAAFKADPAVYAPRFGGYDPVAMARGTATPGNSSLWLIAEQRLYLFYSDEARAAFAADPDSAIDAAERNWPAVRGTLVRN
jgi:hypothetical protein